MRSKKLRAVCNIMYGFPGQIENYRFTIRVKCFNDTCDFVLMHTYASNDYTPRIGGTCPKCGKGYSRKVNNIDENQIIGRSSESVYK